MIRRKKVFLVEDIHLPKDYDIHETGITQSMLGQFPICRQRFLFTVNRWRKIDNDLAPLFGNINHEVFDKMYTMGRKPSNKLIARCIDRYCEEQEDVLSTYALEYLPQESTLSQVVLEEYFKYYESDFEEKYFIEVESVFDVEFEGYRLRGKKDGKFFNLKNPDILWLMEHKNKGRIETDIIEGVLNFDFQNFFYITADHIETGRFPDLTRVLYNIVRKPQHKIHKKESLKDWMERIRIEIKKDPEHFFIRYQCPYTLKSIAEFKKELQSILFEVEAFLKGALPCYKNRMACKMPWKCEFLDACSSGTMVGYKQIDTWFPELDV